MGLMMSSQQEILVWCAEINLCINMEEMKELVGDFRRSHTPSALSSDRAVVEIFHSVKYSGICISEDAVLKHLQPT